jgi:hypothetical protein
MRLVLTADQAVAAIDLWAAEPARGDFEHTAVLADALTAFVFRNALVALAASRAERAQERLAGAVLAADLTVWAIGVVAACSWNTRATVTDFALAAIGGVFTFRWGRPAYADVIDAVVGAARAIACAASAFDRAVIAGEASRRANVYRTVGLPDIDAIDPRETRLDRALAIDAAFARVAVVDAHAAITAFAWVAVVIARAAIVQSDTHVAFAFLAGPTIAIVQARNAIGIGRITWDVTNWRAGRAVAIIATWRARTTLGRAAELARRARRGGTADVVHT